MHSVPPNPHYERALRSLDRIADALERLAPPPAIPNYQFPLEAFSSFDWKSIGAVVEQSDASGATIICWRGLHFTRRSPSNKFGEAIWFSRSIGKNEQGQIAYERLISFRPIATTGQVEPLPDRTRRFVDKAIAIR